MKKIKAHIITGFLGAGKTTAIMNLFKQKPGHEKWIIVINEFGIVAIDSMIIKEHGTSEDEVKEIIGGCICCSSSDLFKSNIDDIIQEQNPDRIIIEPTGLGGIKTIKTILAGFVLIDLQPVICLVDVNTYNNPRFRMNGIYLSQIHDSDIIIVSKCDTETKPNMAGELIDWIKQKYETKLLYTKINNGSLPIGLIEVRKEPGVPGTSDLRLSIVGMATTKDSFVQRSFSYDAHVLFSINYLKEFFSNLDSLIRAKGYINTPQGWMLIHVVMGNLRCEPCAVKEISEIVTIWEDEKSVVDFNALQVCNMAI